MSASNKLIQAAAGVGGEEADADFANTVLLLNADDASNGGQNNTFLDSSSNTHTLTRNGNVTQGSFSPFSVDDGKWGNYFEGSSDYLSVAADSSLAFGTGDFTIEFWANYASARGNFYDARGTSVSNVGIVIFVDSPSIAVNAGTVGLFNETAPSSNTWHHIALTRSGTSLRLFFDGTQVGSTVTNSTNFSTAYTTSIGVPLDSTFTANYSLEGYISNLRVVKGTALYTANFTPSTTPLTAISGTSLLTCQSNRFVDNSSNAHTITPNGDVKVVPFSPFPQTTAYDASTNGGSGYFDGTGDYLDTTSSVKDLGTGDFTIDVFINPSASSSNIIVDTRQTSSNSGWNLYLDSGNAIFFHDTGAGTTITLSGAITLNTWSHIAVTRNSGTVSLYVNGTSQDSGTYTQNLSNGGNFRIGSKSRTLSGIGEFSGYMSNLRVVAGTALYTSNFTPPTAPLTDVSGTSLLCNFTNASVFDATGKNVLETVGNAQVDTTTVKYGTGSMEFDGTGDYLTVPPSDLFDGINDSAFTIEAWINIADNNNRGFFQIAEQYFDNYTDGYVVGQNGTDRLFVTHSGTFTQQASIGYSLNTWFHIALVRNSSGTLKLFVDGVEKISITTDTTSTATTHLLIGGYYTTSNLMNGYIDDFRITKGIARYTANFTPPVRALPVIGEE